MTERKKKRKKRGGRAVLGRVGWGGEGGEGVCIQKSHCTMVVRAGGVGGG